MDLFPTILSQHGENSSQPRSLLTLEEGRLLLVDAGAEGIAITLPISPELFRLAGIFHKSKRIFIL